MPPVDLPQLLIAAAAAAVTYFWQKRSPGVPAPPVPLPSPFPVPAVPEIHNPLVQGLLALLKQLLEQHQIASPKKD